MSRELSLSLKEVLDEYDKVRIENAVLDIDGAMDDIYGPICDIQRNYTEGHGSGPMHKDAVRLAARALWLLTEWL